MKKLIAMAAIVFSAASLYAQFVDGGYNSTVVTPSPKEPTLNVFNRSKSFNIGWVNNTWTPKDGFGHLESKFGVNLSNTKTYYLHKTPVAGMLKFGIDATWFDVTYCNYKSGNGAHIGISGGDFGYDYDEDYDFGDLYDPDEIEYDQDLKFGTHSLDVGIGVGVSATVAPLAFLDNQASYLQAQVYCRFLPSYSLMLITGNDETKFHHGFVPYVTFGGCISWKVIGVFVEGRWGSGKYNGFGVNGDEDIELDEGLDIIGDHKTTERGKNSSLRVGVSFRF